MQVSSEEKIRAKQISRGIAWGCTPYLLILFLIIPWTFAVIGPGPTETALLGSVEGERPSLDVYLLYSTPFILLFIGTVVFVYFKTRNTKPAFAQSLLITSLIVVGLSVLFMALVAFKVYT